MTDERLKLISFTGSAAVGWEIKKNCRQEEGRARAGRQRRRHRSQRRRPGLRRRPLRGRRLRLCGPDLHFGAAHPGGALASAPSSPNYLLAGVGKLKIGDPLDESTDLGPLIRESDAVRASNGCRRRCAAAPACCAADSARARCSEPTVLTGTRPEMKVNCQEIFAPVVTVEPYDDFDERPAADEQFPLRTAGGRVHPRRQADCSMPMKNWKWAD